MAKTAIKYAVIGGGRGEGLTLQKGDITIDGWFKLEPIGPSQPRFIFGYCYPFPPPIDWFESLCLFAEWDGSIRFKSYEIATGREWNIWTPATYRDGLWHHCEANIKNAPRKGRLFIDGVLVAQGEMSFDPSPEIHTTYVNWKRDSETYPVTIDDLRISDAVRHTEDFVLTTQPHPIDANTKAYWHFDEGMGNIAHDAVPGSVDLELDPAPDWVAGIVEEVITMPTIVSHVQLIVERPTEAPGRIPEKWAENLKNEAEWLSEKRDLVIPDETAFQNRIAETSQAGYQTVLNPAFWSRSGLPAAEIKGNRLAKIKEAFKKWQRGLSHAFQTVEGVFAKRFKEAVDLRRDIYSEGAAQRTLAYTGTKFQFRGPATLSGYWLTAVPGIEGLLRSGDKILAGTPLRICVPAKAFTLRSALLARLVQAGVVITNNGYDPAIIARINQVNNEVIQGFVDTALDLIPFVAGGDSHVDFVVIEGQLYLDIKVSKM